MGDVSSASAGAAVVDAVQGVARAAPHDIAPVLHTFPAGALVQVTDDETNGWRRVFVPGGRFGYIRQAALRLSAASAGLVTPLPGPVTGEAAMPVRFVGTLAALGDAMAGDSLLHPRARSLATRQAVALGVVGVGGVAGLILSIGSATFLAGQDCSELAGTTRCMPSLNRTALVGGMMLLAGSFIAGYTIGPTAGEVTDLVNDWNVRHPEQPYALPPGFGHHHHHHRY